MLVFEMRREPCLYLAPGRSQWCEAILVHGPWGDRATIEVDGRLTVVPACRVLQVSSGCWTFEQAPRTFEPSPRALETVWRLL